MTAIRPFRAIAAGLFVFGGVASADTILVLPDGTGDAATIQDAIFAASDGDVVALGDGVFQGVGNRAVDFLGKAVTLESESGNASACIIDCQSQARAFDFVSGEGPGTLVRALTVRNGAAIGPVASIEGNGGIALFLGGSSPVFEDCTFEDSMASGDGGAFYSEADGDPVILRSTFRNNEAVRGGAMSTTGSPRFEECAFQGNVASVGGGVAMTGLGTLPTFHSCLFAGNSASIEGGAVFITGVQAEMENCTIVLGRSNVVGACISASFASRIVIRNSILAFSTRGEAVYCTPTGEAVLECCDVYGNAGGDFVNCIAGQEGVDGNFSEDPAFCDLDSGDFGLTTGSPCAPDAGSCGLIGAFGVACENPTPVVPQSWGQLKSRYQESRF